MRYRIAVLEPDEVSRLASGALVVPHPAAIYRLEGPGAVECLQGVLTSDVVRPAVDSLSYGALLTPKGMIVSDLWSLRDDLGFTILVPPEGAEAAISLFRRQFPPRLARIRELGNEAGALELLGSSSPGVLNGLGLPFPAGEGRVARAPWKGHQVSIARGWKAVPWQALMVGSPEALEQLSAELERSGALQGNRDHAEAARILAGWPALGREIADKTLPQEVRYDEIGGVSYTKGCYVGQETVARVHFRGHPNRHLRGLAWTDARAEPGLPIRAGSRQVGQLGSVLESGSRRWGLSVLRREVKLGTEVTIEPDIPARVSSLPFDLEPPPAS